MLSAATALVLTLNALLMVQPASAAYTKLAASYTPNNFFDQFDFYTGSDPTNCHVKYVGRSSAQSQGIIKNEGSAIYIGVDHWSYASTGRPTVRIESKQRFNGGLFVLDVQHMPSSTCGTWAAFWTLGDNWPTNGEIDILEGVHKSVQNGVSLHTANECSINTTSSFTGTVQTPNCHVGAPGQANNAGCNIKDERTNSYGDGLNNAGGGVYAMEWTTTAIKVWWLPRNRIPANVWCNPDPTKWGLPVASFTGDCNIPESFKDHKIIFDITFCGDWAGNVWTQSGCGKLAKTCIDYVSNNPGAFANTYWRINSMKVWSLP